MNSKYISVREFAKIKGVEVVGKLKRVPVRPVCPGEKISNIRIYVDEAGNEYWLIGHDASSPSCIVTYDGGVI